MKTPVSCLWIALTAASPAVADTVHDGSGAYDGVRILGIVDDELRFRMPDGRVLNKLATELRWISVSSERDRAADALSRAEQLRDRGRPKRATQQYAEVRSETRIRWMQGFAIMRLGQIHDRRGQFADALDAYLALAPRNPILARRIVPRNLPAAGTKAARAALTKIAAARRRPQPADVSVMLRRLRKDIESGKGTTGDADESKPAESRNRRDRTKTSGRSGRNATGTRKNALAGVRKAIARGDLTEASKRFAAGRKATKPAEEPVWLVLEAELLHAGKDHTGAGLAAMRVVVLHPQSEHVAAALYWAGRSFESMGRRHKALRLYAECLRQDRIPPAVRELTEARIETEIKPESPGRQ